MQLTCLLGPWSERALLRSSFTTPCLNTPLPDGEPRQMLQTTAYGFEKRCQVDPDPPPLPGSSVNSGCWGMSLTVRLWEPQFREASSLPRVTQEALVELGRTLQLVRFEGHVLRMVFGFLNCLSQPALGTCSHVFEHVYLPEFLVV